MQTEFLLLHAVYAEPTRKINCRHITFSIFLISPGGYLCGTRQREKAKKKNPLTKKKKIERKREKENQTETRVRGATNAN